MKRKIDNLGRISIPIEFRKEIGLKNEEEAAIEIDGKKIIITNPVELDYKELWNSLKEWVENFETRTIQTGQILVPIDTLLMKMEDLENEVNNQYE